MDRLRSLQEKLQECNEKYHEYKGKYDHLIEEKESKEEKIRLISQQNEIFLQVRTLLQKSSEYAREQAKREIEKLVTYILQFVFGEEFSFVIEIEEKNNRPEAEFFVVTVYNGVTVKLKPQDARGGGVVDLVSLALRVAMLHLYQPSIQGPLVLDEPAKHVSEEYINNVAEILQETSMQFGRQIIVVTHNQQLSGIADRAFKVEIVKGASQVLVYG